MLPVSLSHHLVEGYRLPHATDAFEPSQPDSSYKCVEYSRCSSKKVTFTICGFFSLPYFLQEIFGA